MTKIIATFFSFLLILTSCAQNKKEMVVTIKTSYGDMIAILYDETPKHKENFIKLAKEHYYDSILFHRVIETFMIQGGDPNSKRAKPGEILGQGGPGYTIPAEFNSKFFHEKGALSAARLGDEQNPTKASSGSQFYIVQGKKYSDEELNQGELGVQYARKNQYLREILEMPKYAAFRQVVMQKSQAGDSQWLNSFFEKSDTLIMKEKTGYTLFKYSAEQRARYKEVGGAPHLDGDYTVFGKVIKGLDVVDKIAAVQKDQAARPVQDIRMFVTVEEMSRNKIAKEYGYVFPDK